MLNYLGPNFGFVPNDMFSCDTKIKETHDRRGSKIVIQF